MKPVYKSRKGQLISQYPERPSVGHTVTYPIGFDFFRCANPNCGAELGVDHVTLITTAHIRRFCCVECIAAGNEANMQAIGGG